MSDTTKKLKSGTTAKVLMPVVATLASAAASYLAKKGPQYVEQLMPKVKETTGSAASGVGDVAHDLSERAKSVVGADSGSNGSSSRSLDEIAKRRDERAAHRAARRKAS
jgi:hypothetical protein